MRKFKLFGAPLAVTLGALIPLTADSIEDRLKKQEIELQAIREHLDDVKSSLGGGWPSWFSLNGEWEFEYSDPEADPNQDSSANSHARFKSDKLVLKPKIKLSKNLYMKGEIEFGTDDGRLEEYHAHFKLPGGSEVQVGFDERFTKAGGSWDMANRKTENYPILGSAFWRDEELGIVWGGKEKIGGGLENVFWKVSYGNGLELNERQIGENDTYEVTHDNDQASDSIDNKKEWGFGLGFTFRPSDDYVFDIAGWHFESELNNDEKTRLQGITGYASKEVGASTAFPATLGLNQPSLYKSRQQRFGGRTTHKFGNTTVTYEAAGARDGAFRRKGQYIQASHKFGFKPLIGGEFIKSVEPLVRVEEYRTNLQPVFGDAETWNRKQFLYALLIGITSSKSLKSTLKLEYTINDEKTGATAGVMSESDDPDNDEFLAQLELKF